MLGGIRVPALQDFLTTAGLEGEITARGNGGGKGLDKLPELVVLIESIGYLTLIKEEILHLICLRPRRRTESPWARTNNNDFVELLRHILPPGLREHTYPRPPVSREKRTHPTLPGMHSL